MIGEAAGAPGRGVLGSLGMDTARPDTVRLAALAESIHTCTDCRLGHGRILAVPGEGAMRLGAMLIGEAPGQMEDETGRPFVGRSGRLLDAILEQAGADRDDFFITSAAKCRPPGNRNPRTDEIAACNRWLTAQIEALDPAVLVVMCLVAARAVLGEKSPLKDLRGRQLRGPGGRPAVVTYHPSAALRFTKARAALGEDLAALVAQSAAGR